MQRYRLLMWPALLRSVVGFRSAAPARAEHALEYLNDVYRFAWFLSGSSDGAEKLVQEAYERTWREYLRGRTIRNWRLSLLRCLLDIAEDLRFSGEGPEGDERRSPMWGELLKLDFRRRALVILDALDLQLVEIAWVARASEAEVTREWRAALEALDARTDCEH